ncbi:protein DESIGUAL 2-like [Phragmites australis]|uniref:protein DESIGUAL 2-like n=1 Tax=Phragmites australis TaxID=29695 RepID=UPI002D781A91|nr:protein DESIGUAL 2-like [Phragmites australis]XP_062196461.1 protein DESIGUAL 2-like [Phragmites australis]
MARVQAVIAVCLVILALDVSAGMMAIQAQAAENKGKGVAIIFFQCKKPVYEAYQLGLAAAVLLVVAHAVACSLGGCLSQLDSIWASSNRILALLSWMAVIVGFLLLRDGAMSNAKSEISWGFIHVDILALGGKICFVHCVITIAYYITAAALQFA